MNIDDVINIEDLHRIAKRKLPNIIFDYIEGGVEDERGLARNEAAFHKHRLLPRYLVDVSKRDQSRRFSAAPIRARSAFRRPAASASIRARRRGDAGRGGARRQHPLHHVGRQQRLDGGSAPGSRRTMIWFQLYAAKDAGITDALIGRARDAGLGALVLTVDVPVHPKRERNIRNGFRHVRGGGVSNR